jgi:hypothetical protein
MIERPHDEARGRSIRAHRRSKRGRRRRLASVVVAAVASAIALVGLAGPASAANLPYDNTNPVTTGCAASGYTVGSRSITSISGQAIGKVELRYSSACGTNWSRVTSYIGSTSLLAWSTRSFDGVTTYGGPGGDPGPYYGTSAYSDQLYGNGYTVCAYGALPDPNNWGNYAGTNYCA